MYASSFSFQPNCLKKSALDLLWDSLGTNDGDSELKLILVAKWDDKRFENRRSDSGGVVPRSTERSIDLIRKLCQDESDGVGRKNG